LTGFRPLASLLPLAALLLVAGQTPRPGAGLVGAQAHAPAAPTLAAAPARDVGFGFRDFTRQAALDAEFLAVPDARLAQQHLQLLTAAPHWASSPQDYATALYVAARFKAAGLQTEIVPYSVLIDKPVSTLIEAFDASGNKIFSGPTREHVAPAANGAVDHFQDDPSVLPGFNSSSPAGDVTAPVVFVNRGRIQDFQRLAELGISLKDKIALLRYGGGYRGSKVYLAQQYGAKGVLLYSDPADDGSSSGEAYPDGPERPNSAVQRGSVQFLPIYPGDPTTPGVASVPGLPASQRIPIDKLRNDLPSIPVEPLSSADAAPILRALGGPAAPHDWQGGLPFSYHVGGNVAAPVTVHMQLVRDARLRTIWDVVGKIPGESEPNQWVIAGNHRDAWVYGAADPGSGTAAMLEAVHGLGVLLQHGWKPRRTIVMASWDGEEEGLIGSTEWVEQHPAELDHAVAYFNVDEAVAGPEFNAGAVPSLRQFLREIANQVPSPAGGTVLEQWRQAEQQHRRDDTASASLQPADEGVPVGDLGSGSDFTPFLQHAGVPSTDIGSDGSFGVYHTVYDDYDWFVRFADPTFAYTQQQARFFGLEILHMADADVLPYDYRIYAEEIRRYLDQARTRAAGKGLDLDFTGALAAARSFAAAAQAAHELQEPEHAPPNAAALNRALCAAEHALLIPAGLPRRPWYKHSIYAPGEFTGYSAEVIPGVSDAIEAMEPPRAQAQLGVLAQALDRAAAALNQAAQ
jgi:N-acetylated-alpha-linked acidic dipeptidase